MSENDYTVLPFWKLSFNDNYTVKLFMQTEGLIGHYLCVKCSVLATQALLREGSGLMDQGHSKVLLYCGTKPHPLKCIKA